MSMAVYHKCPNCDNIESGASIFQCNKCQNKGCIKSRALGFGSSVGCWTKQPCPVCDNESSCRVGYIK